MRCKVIQLIQGREFAVWKSSVVLALRSLSVCFAQDDKAR